MRTFRHWTPAYVVNRILEKRYRRMHPDEPWLTPAAIQFLKGYLRAGDHGLEYGSGGSTIWFAKRISNLTSVEHDLSWFEKVKGWLADKGITNVTYIHAAIDPQADSEKSREYISAARKIQDESLDFILVDGRHRDECANMVLPKLKKGAILILDNADVYLPSDSNTPNARSISQGPATQGWAVFLKNVEKWRCYWTCNGISATAIYFKPY
jgi:predicted O-methyltransferase YrrM